MFMFLECKQLDGNDPRVVINLKSVMLAVPAQGGKVTIVTLTNGAEMVLKVPFEDYSALSQHWAPAEPKKEKEVVSKMKAK